MLQERPANNFGIAFILAILVAIATGIFILLYGKNESPGPNEANYKNKQYDALYEKVAPMADSAERNALIAKMRQIAFQDIPWIMGLHRMETRLAQPWMFGYKIHSFEHNHEQYWKIDTELRKKSLQ